MANKDGIKIALQDNIVPPESDIIINIDYQEADESAARVFDIAADLIRSFEDLDRILITSIASEISTQIVLEDLEKSSLKIFLRNILRATDDQALKDLDWRPQVGKYLVKAKYAVLSWLDTDDEKASPPDIKDLTEEILDLAKKTDVRYLPDYPTLNPARLAQPLDQIQRAKEKFKENEKLTITLDTEEYSVDLGSIWLATEKLDLNAIEQELANEAEMVLIVRKPDFLGQAQWVFRHGKSTFNARFEDESWLEEFHNAAHVLVPGDALRVRVRFEHKYDSKGNLKESSHIIVRVLGIIRNVAKQKEMFDK